MKDVMKTITQSNNWFIESFQLIYLSSRPFVTYTQLNYQWSIFIVLSTNKKGSFFPSTVSGASNKKRRLFLFLLKSNNCCALVVSNSFQMKNNTLYCKIYFRAGVSNEQSAGHMWPAWCDYAARVVMKSISIGLNLFVYVVISHIFPFLLPAELMSSHSAAHEPFYRPNVALIYIWAWDPCFRVTSFLITLTEAVIAVFLKCNWR